MKNVRILPILAIAMGALAITTPTRAAFDGIGPTARGAALGGCATALARDASGLYHNPALLTEAGEAIDVGFVHNRIGNLDFLSYNLAYVGTQIGDNLGVAAGLRSFGTDAPTGGRLSTEQTLSIAAGYTVMEDVHSNLSLGVTLHWLHMNLGTSAGTWSGGTGDDGEYVGGVELGSGSTFGIDIGIAAQLERRTTVAALLRNANRPSLGDRERVTLPETLVLAGAYEPYSRVVTTFEAEMESGRDPARFRAGLEYQPSDILVLRAGTGSNPVRMSAGFGLYVNRFTIDYAYGSHSVLPGNHIFGMGVEF